MKSSNKLTPGQQAILAAERHRRISERAYFRAAARGFVGDLQIDDWLVAEREVDAMAASGEPPAPQPPQPLGIEQNPRTNHGPSKARRA
jgi:Protein of unknown function (DUF2934)